MQPPSVEELEYQDEEAIDLLNLNTGASTTTASYKSPSSNFDLLSGLNDNASSSFGDFVSSGTAPVINPKTTTDDLFDPFGTANANADNKNTLLGDWANVNVAPNINVTNPLPEQQQKPKDLFADLADLTAGLNFNNQKTTSNGNSSPYMVPPTTPQHGPPTTPQHQARSPINSRPDYSRSHFDNLNKGEQKIDTKNGKPKTEDVFGDLLGSQGYQFANKKDNFPRTINEMRKEELIKEMDPDKLRILEWVSISSFLNLNSYPNSTYSYGIMTFYYKVCPKNIMK